MIIGISGKIGSGKDTIGQIIQYLTSPLNESTTLVEFYEQEWKAKKSAWQIKKFADKLKECTSIILGIPREDLEKIEVKNSNLPECWNHTWHWDIENKQVRCLPGEGYDDSFRTMTVRQFLQELGTEVGRQIHPNFWVNALFSEYRPLDDTQRKSMLSAIDYSDCPFPNWIITDMRFPNELKAVRDRKGVTIRVNRDVVLDNNNQPISSNKSYTEIDIMRTQHPSETALDNANFHHTIDNNGTIEELIEKVKEILIKEAIL